jgi:hypothetical protein
MSDELVDLMKKPQEMLDNALSAMTKKAAASYWAQFKLFLATGSEPLMRKNMGERYFSSQSLGQGLVVWLFATYIALAVPSVRSGGAWLCYFLHLYGLERLFQPWGLTFLTGGAFIVCFWIFGGQSLAAAAKFRAEGAAYHTQSRGVPRWTGSQAYVPFAISAALLLFDLPTGILFLVSLSTSAKLAAEQQAAIYSRYLDQLDKKIENEYLEDAILGKCPTEITQLVKPLSSSLNPELRENIAAAAVGKSVQILAKGPNRSANPSSRAASQPLSRPTEAQPPDAASVPLAGPAAVRPQEPRETFTPAPTANPNATAASAPKPMESKPNPSAYLLIIGILAVSLAALAMLHFWPSKHINTPAQIASLPLNVQPVQQSVIPTPSPPPVQSVVQNQNPEPPPAQTEPPVVAPAPPPVDTAALERAALEKQRQEEQTRIAQERQQRIDQFYSSISQKVADLAQAQIESNNRLNNNTNKIAKASRFRRWYLRRDNVKAAELVKKELQNQQDTLNLLKDSVRSFASDTNADPSQITQTFQAYDETTAAITRNINLILKNMDDDIAGNNGNSGNSGLIQIR